MTDPVFDLAGDPNGIDRAIGRGHVAGELLVREVRVVLEWARRLDDIDAASAFAPGEFRPPSRRVERGAEINVLQAALHKIASEAGCNQVADFDGRLGSMIENGPAWDVLRTHRQRLR